MVGSSPPLASVPPSGEKARHSMLSVNQAVQSRVPPALLAQQRQHVGRSVALRILCLHTQLVEQREQVLLHFSSSRVYTPYLLEQRYHQEPLLSLPHVFLGGGQF